MAARDSRTRPPLAQVGRQSVIVPHYQSALVWFRRDLRDFDHAALYHALRAARSVHCAFVFDREILDALPRPEDRRVEFIRHSVAELAASLTSRGSALIVRHAVARDAIPQLAVELGVAAVYANHDYEPAARDRDAHVAERLAARGIALAHRQGPRDLRARRGAVAGRPAVLGVHTLQERMAQDA